MFDNMSDTEIYCFKKAVNGFMEKENIHSYGVVVYTLGHFPAMLREVTTLGGVTPLDTLPGYCPAFYGECRVYDAELSRRFDMFFDCCVADGVVKTDLQSSVSYNVPLVSKLLTPRKESYDAFIVSLRDEPPGAAARLRALDEFLGGGGELTAEVAQSRDRAYS